MLFNPKNIERGEGYLRLGEQVSCVAHKSIDCELFSELWRGYTYRTSNIEFSACDTLTFTLGDAEPLPLGEYDYTVNVTERGACVSAKSEAELCRGAAAVGIVYALIVGFALGELKVKDLPRIMISSLKTSTMVNFIIAAASLFSWVVSKSQIGVAISEGFIKLVGGSVNMYLLVLPDAWITDS